MIAYKINITIDKNSKTFISDKRDEFSYVFRKGYKKYNELSTIELEKYIKQNFDLNDIERRGVISKIKSQFNSTIKNKDEKYDRIVDITEKIDDLKTEKEKYKIRDKFKLTKKLGKLDKFLSHDVVFGTKYFLQKISYLSNYKNDEDKMIKLDLYKQQYQDHRKQEIYLLGEANQKGNRFFEFDFINKQLIYKPNIKTKISIKLNVIGKYYKNLLKLQKMIDTKDIAVTIGLTENYINIIFDEEILSGYSINTKERKKDVQIIKDKKLNKEFETIRIKEICQKYYKEQEINMMKDKISNRIISFDSNPNYIGYSIIDNNKEIKVIHTGYYDLSKINKKLPKKISKEQRKHVNNKRIHEICHIWKDIFTIAYHYKVGNFGMEELNFTSKEVKDNSKEFNRQTKNIWHRTLSEQLINKYTKTQGIKKIECNPIYTSFIGNLNYNFVDPTNSSIEIGRRCINKYIKNNIFYPNFCIDTIIHTMSKLNDIKLRDVEIIKDSENWKVLYKNIKSTGLRYRISLKDIELLGDVKYHKSNKLLHRNVNKIMFN